MVTDVSHWPKAIKVYLIATIVLVYFCKIVVVLFMAIDDIIRLFRWIVSLLTKSKAERQLPENSISRLQFISWTALALAAIPFASLIKGMITGAYDYTVHRSKVKIPNLPESFKGLKIVQISDIHIGSFISTEPLEKAFKIIQDLKPDVILFTGDLVNNLASETDGFTDTLRMLKAPMGVYSILGNHDYGDYHQFPSPEEKVANLNRLKAVHGEVGFRLLLNENVHLERNGEKIAILGIENWGAYGRFPKYGKLDEALKGTENTAVKILMSHDPSHWTEVISKQNPDINLTLSGHTHGMQFGIEIPGFKWSPIKYMYPHWADLYSNTKGQYLYVNRGLGFLGYPGRVGILPEITVIELA